MSKLRLFWAKETKISSLEGRELMFEHEDNNAKTMNNQVGTWVAIIYIKNQIGYS